ncbi:hypothetical protein AAMO2058_000774100 [Amorphochlora amoebiformis]
MVSKGRVFVILAVLVALVLSDQVSDRVGSRNKLEAKVEEKVLLESCLEAARRETVGGNPQLECFNRIMRQRIRDRYIKFLPAGTFNQTQKQIEAGVGRDSPEAQKDRAMGMTPPGVHPAIVPVKAVSPTEDQWILPQEYQTWSVADAFKKLKKNWSV